MKETMEAQEGKRANRSSRPIPAMGSKRPTGCDGLLGGLQEGSRKGPRLRSLGPVGVEGSQLPGVVSSTSDLFKWDMAPRMTEQGNDYNTAAKQNKFVSSMRSPGKTGVGTLVLRLPRDPPSLGSKSPFP